MSLDAAATLAQCRGALAAMLDPRSPPSTAKSASDWLQEYRSENESRNRRVKRTPAVRASAWPTLVALLTVPDSTPGEQLFASQALLYRVRRMELADALDMEDPVAMALPPSSSAKPSDEATAQANAASLATLSQLTLAACGGGTSKPVVLHLCLSLVHAVIRAGTTCPADQDTAFCADLVGLVRHSIEQAAAQQAEVQPAADGGAALQAAAASALLQTLAALPEAAALQQMSIRPRALAAALHELRSDRAGEGLLATMAALNSHASGEERLRCVLQWVAHVGLRTPYLAPVVPAVGEAVAAVAALAHASGQGAAATVASAGGEALTVEGYAGAELAAAIFEAAVEKAEGLRDVGSVRITANGKRKARKNRAGNSSDVEQQFLEVHSATAAAEVAAAAAAACAPHLAGPLRAALAVAVEAADGRACGALAQASCAMASAELPRLLTVVAGCGGGEEGVEGARATLRALLELLLATTAVDKRLNAAVCALTFEPWTRFHDAVLALSGGGGGDPRADWLGEAEAAMQAALGGVLGGARLPADFGDDAAFDGEDREAFGDARKEVRDWLRGMVTGGGGSGGGEDSGAVAEGGEGEAPSTPLARQPGASRTPLAPTNARLAAWVLQAAATDLDAYTADPYGGAGGIGAGSGALSGGVGGWIGAEAALHAVSALGRAVVPTAAADASGHVDAVVGATLACLGRPAPRAPIGSPGSPGGFCEGDEPLACAAHPAVATAGVLAVGALAHWVERRLAMPDAGPGSPGGGGPDVASAAAALEGCRRLCFASLRLSDRHPAFPVRSHDDLHAGATALLKLAGAGPVSLTASAAQGWFHGLHPYYLKLSARRWWRAFPGTEPPGGSGGLDPAAAAAAAAAGGGDDDLPLSPASRRVLLAVLVVLATAAPDAAAGPAAAAAAVSGRDDVDGSAAAVAFPLLAQLVGGLCEAVDTAAAAAGLSDEPPTGGATADAEALGSRGEGSVALALRVALDVLADLEVATFLSAGQAPCTRHAATLCAALLGSARGVASLRRCLRLAHGASALCGPGGDSGRLVWGGRAGKGGALIVIEPDCGVAELSGLVRWVLSRALARCASHHPQGFGLPRPLLELCLSAHASDCWADGAMLYPLATALGGGLGGGGAPSFSSHGLGSASRKDKSGDKDSGDKLVDHCGASSVATVYTDALGAAAAGRLPQRLRSAAGQARAGEQWEISEWLLGAAAGPTMATLTLGFGGSSGSGGAGPSVLAHGVRPPLALNGPALRRGTALEALFALGAVAVDKWTDASLVAAAAGAAVSASPAWLQLVPAACSLLLGDAGGYDDHDGGGGGCEAAAVAEAAGLGAALRVGRGMGGSNQAACARKDQTVSLALPGREAEVVIKFLTAALAAGPALSLASVLGGAATVGLCLLRGACGATPSWALDSTALCLRQLAAAAALAYPARAAELAAHALAAAGDGGAAACFPGATGGGGRRGGGDGGGGGPLTERHAAAAHERMGQAQLLVEALAAAVEDERFPRRDVSAEAKAQFLATVGAQTLRHDWSGVKCAVKQLCGGKRKTGPGKSLGRPPDHSPWEANFDSRSITGY